MFWLAVPTTAKLHTETDMNAGIQTSYVCAAVTFTDLWGSVHFIPDQGGDGFLRQVAVRGMSAALWSLAECEPGENKIAA